MKINVIFTILLLFIASGIASFSQDRSKVMSEKSIAWYGVDFSIGKFTLVTENPAVIVNQYLKAINSLILAEPNKFDLKTFFNKNEVTNDLEQVTERNEKIDPSALVVSDEHKITLDDVKAEIKKYNTKGKSGMGLVFIAENLNKTTQMGSFYVCFFDIATKEIIDARQMTGKAAGFGFRNYWSGSIYNIMKAWLK
jgi:hypothetical protein